MNLHNIELGKWGEEKAANYLLNNNYTILAKNFTARTGEIDIIARKNKYLVFVEVKTRNSSTYGPPGVSIDSNKIKKIRQTASYFLILEEKKIRNKYQIRFDVITIRLIGARSCLEHYRNAF